nr:xylulose kinase-1 [Tanacetum cinerariifolium]
MPPKCDLRLIDEHFESVSVDGIPNIAPSDVKTVESKHDESEEEISPIVEVKIVKPIIKKIKFVKTARETVKNEESPKQHKHHPRENQRNWNNLMSQRLGSNFKMINKACYVCGSFEHLQYECDQRVVKLVWNNTRTVNHKNFGNKSFHPHPKRRFVPQAVLTRSGKINTAGATVTTVVRLVNTAGLKSTVNHPILISHAFKRGHSQVIRPFNKYSAYKKTIFNKEVNAVKASGCWVCRPKEARLKLMELMELSTKLSDRVLNLEKIKAAQAKEITDLKKRVKNLERKRRSRTQCMNLFKIGEARGDMEKLGDELARLWSIPFVLSWRGNISLDSFLPSILLLVVIVVTVVVVVVILIFVFVAIVAVVIVVMIIGVVIVVTIIGVVIVVIAGGIPSIIKLSFMITGSFSCYQSFTWLGVPIGMVSIFYGSSLCFKSYDNTISNQLPDGSQSYGWCFRYELVEEEDRKQTCFLGGNNSSRTKKSRGLNSGNGNTGDGDKIVDEVIGVGIEYSIPAVSSSLLLLASITAVKQIVINIVLKGNSAKSITTDKDGNLKIHPPVTAEEHQQVQREEKARTILFLHFQRNIWKMDKGYDKMQKILSQMNTLKIKPKPEDVNIKFLRSLPPFWSSIALILKTKGGLEYISFDDLYNKLMFLEIDTKGYSSSSSTHSNAAFVSTAGLSQGKLSYQESGNGGYGGYTTTRSASPSSSSSKDLDQMNKEEFKEYDLKQQMAMLSIKEELVHQRLRKTLTHVLELSSCIYLDDRAWEVLNFDSAGM